MIKPKIKIKEIKKKIKVTEIVKEPEESLEEIVVFDESSPPASETASTPSNPSLVQHLNDIPMPKNERKIATENASTRDEKEASTAVNYATSQTQRRRSYDSSIRASGNVSSSSQAAGERINPTINPSNIIIEQVNRNKFDLDRRDSITEIKEPSLRSFKDENERNYEVDDTRKYESRRNKMM
jgi:hypothetical protein